MTLAYFFKKGGVHSNIKMEEYDFYEDMHSNRLPLILQTVRTGRKRTGFLQTIRQTHKSSDKGKTSVIPHTWRHIRHTLPKTNSNTDI